jgi:hypothetical protein
VDEHVADAEERDAQPRAEAQPCSTWQQAVRVMPSITARSHRTSGPECCSSASDQQCMARMLLICV